MGRRLPDRRRGQEIRNKEPRSDGRRSDANDCEEYLWDGDEELQRDEYPVCQSGRVPQLFDETGSLWEGL